MRFLLLALSLFLPSLATAAELTESLVEIESLDGDGHPLAPCGVGILVGPGAVLTARHVARPHGQNAATFRFRRAGREPIAIGVGDPFGIHISVGEDGADLAIIKVDPDRLQGPVAPTGWMSDEQVRRDPEALLVSDHHGQCHGQGEPFGYGTTWHATPLSPEQPDPESGPAIRRFVLRPEIPNYSGSPVVSRTTGRVVAVYVGASSDGALGYAESLAHAQSIFSDALQLTLEQAWPVPHFLLLDVTGALAAWEPDPQLSSRIPELMLGGRVYQPWVGPFWSESLWLLPGLFGGFETRARGRVVSQVPGVGVLKGVQVFEPLFILQPSIALRFEWRRVSATFDPGVRVVRILGDDAQTALELEPRLEFGVRLLPLPSGYPATRSIGVFVSAARGLASTVRVSDFRFDLSGAPGEIRRPWSTLPTSVRLGVEVGL